MSPRDQDRDLAGQLGHEMRDRVDRISDAPVSLDAVKDTAGRIRRRRAAAAGGIIVAAARAFL
ncbi:MAG: hypothetical protein L0H93_02205, partial [Nocardioides sp.]|nr:hypothetical protein [Nocardioides sp.]